MELLFYGIIIFFALFIGVLLHKVTGDEVKIARKWFHIIEVILLGIIIVYSATFVTVFWQNVLLLIFGIFLGVFFVETYLYFGILLAFIQDYFMAFMLFFTALIDGTFLSFYKNFKWQIFVRKGLFFFLPFLLILYPKILELIVPIAIGALIPHIVLHYRISNAQ